MLEQYHLGGDTDGPGSTGLSQTRVEDRDLLSAWLIKLDAVQSRWLHTREKDLGTRHMLADPDHVL